MSFFHPPPLLLFCVHPQSSMWKYLLKLKLFIIFRSGFSFFLCEILFAFFFASAANIFIRTASNGWEGENCENSILKRSIVEISRISCVSFFAPPPFCIFFLVVFLLILANSWRKSFLWAENELEKWIQMDLCGGMKRGLERMEYKRALSSEKRY